VHKIVIFSDDLEHVKQLNFSLQKFESDNIEFEKVLWEFKISIYLKSGYLSFALESTLKKELVIENVRAICWIVPKKYLLLLDQTIVLHFRSSIDRPLKRDLKADFQVRLLKFCYQIENWQGGSELLLIIMCIRSQYSEMSYSSVILLLLLFASKF
jgi:hypothetical protein